MVQGQDSFCLPFQRPREQRQAVGMVPAVGPVEPAKWAASVDRQSKALVWNSAPAICEGAWSGPDMAAQCEGAAAGVTPRVAAKVALPLIRCLVAPHAWINAGRELQGPIVRGGSICMGPAFLPAARLVLCANG